MTFRFLVPALAGLLLTGCELLFPKKPPPEPNYPHMAARHCATEGLQFTQESMFLGTCGNPATGKKCEVWAYFRKECAL